MSFIPKIELQSPEVILAFQLQKLNELLPYLRAKSPFYKKHFSTHTFNTDSLRSLNDLTTLPPVSKDDLQTNNWDFLCVDRKEIVEYTSTSGTLGKPVTIALTENDLKRLAYNEYISFACADGSSDDVYQLMLTLDRQFMAGIAYYEGIRQLQAGVIRIGPGLPALQWETIARLKPTAIVAVPSFIVKLMEYAELNGIDYQSTSVKKAICIGESLRTAELELNTLGKRIRDHWGITLFSTYASTEMQTAFTECTHGQGGHLHPELLIAEFLDENHQPVKEGEPGEVVITTLGVEGMPLLRYKTGDIARHYTTPCSCGRTTLRIGPIEGRRQQMIKLRGTTIYPAMIFELLHQISEVKDYAVEVSTGELGTDELKFYLAVKSAPDPALITRIKSFVQSRLRVLPDILFCTPQEMEQLHMAGQIRKPKKFIDNRIK